GGGGGRGRDGGGGRGCARRRARWGGKGSAKLPPSADRQALVRGRESNRFGTGSDDVVESGSEVRPPAETVRAGVVEGTDDEEESRVADLSGERLDRGPSGAARRFPEHEPRGAQPRGLGRRGAEERGQGSAFRS